MTKDFNIIQGDCIEVMKMLDANCVDAVVTDPPYGLSFMGKKWDYDVPSVEIWQEVLRVLKPGGHLLSFGGTRTYHRMVVNIEDAGFEIRDQIQWIYGSGFPKSLDVSKAIDKEQGVESLREFSHKNPADRPYTHVIGETSTGWQSPVRPDKTRPYSDSAKQWEGWGTALKPANEPICLARKPLIGTVAENVKTHGTGAINIDGCRVGTDLITAHGGGINVSGRKYGGGNGIPSIEAGSNPHIGRFPANVIHDGSEEVLAHFPYQQSGANPKRRGSPKFRNSYGEFQGQEECEPARGFDEGSAARFFYCAKTSKSDRNHGLEDFEIKRPDSRTSTGMGTFEQKGVQPQQNHHPTVKPTELMQYLCRLITPPNGLILDPFLGSGSTMKAALIERFRCVGIELDPKYVEIARNRITKLQVNLF